MDGKMMMMMNDDDEVHEVTACAHSADTIR